MVSAHRVATRLGIADINWDQGMGYAGTAGMVWGWMIAMIFIQCIAMSMAELCSAMPTRYDFLVLIELGLREANQ
jgi:amino acid permease